MERLITVEHIELVGIPVLSVAGRALTGPSPTVLLYHGWGSKKDSQIITAEALACDGFRVLIPDLPFHGSRNPLGDFFSPDAWSKYWDIVLQAVDELPELCASAIDSGLAVSDRIGLAGSSAGGQVCASAMARNPWVVTSVLLNSYPGFESLVKKGRGTEVQDPLLERIRDYDPEALVPQIAPRPFLMMHGTADTIFSVEGVRRFHQVASPLYTHSPERFELIELPRLDHWVTVGMVGTMRQWLLRYL